MSGLVNSVSEPTESYNRYLSQKINTLYKYVVPIPVAARSKAWVCGRSIAGIVGSNPARGMESVSCECCVFSGRGLCVGLITRPEKSYRVWCV